MNRIEEIRLQLGEDTCQEFQRFWNTSVVVWPGMQKLRAEFRPVQKSGRGFSLVVPPEVVLSTRHILEFLRSEAARELIKGFAGSLEALAAQFLWRRLKQFFGFETSRPKPSEVTIIIGARKVVFNASKMGAGPPTALTQALSGSKKPSRRTRSVK